MLRQNKSVLVAWLISIALHAGFAVLAYHIDWTFAKKMPVPREVFIKVEPLPMLQSSLGENEVDPKIDDTFYSSTPNLTTDKVSLNIDFPFIDAASGEPSEKEGHYSSFFPSFTSADLSIAGSKNNKFPDYSGDVGFVGKNYNALLNKFALQQFQVRATCLGNDFGDKNKSVRGGFPGRGFTSNGDTNSVGQGNSPREVGSQLSREVGLPGPGYGRNFLPIYPEVARKLGYEGLVVILATVGTDGRCQKAEVKESSNYEILDQSALNAIKEWTFIPAKKNGKPIEGQIEIPVRFKLKKGMG